MPINFNVKYFFFITPLLLFLFSSLKVSAQDTIQIPKFEFLEMRFQTRISVDNPFTTYILRLRITAPDGRHSEIDGFFAGDGKGGQVGNIWLARIYPDQPGTWQWEVIPGDVSDQSIIGKKGSFECVESDKSGALVAKKEHFYYQNGQPVYLQGNFLDFSDNLVSTHVFMSELVPERQRNKILQRQLQQRVNKINIYIANKGDYRGMRVWPWLHSDQMRMDLSGWTELDNCIQKFEESGLFVALWFFADDSGFGKLDQKIKNQLYRYAMARTSAYYNTFYIIALEWQEGWSLRSLRESGKFIQLHNPWKRIVSVHNIPSKKADSIRSFISIFYRNLFGSIKYSDEPWADFIASQAGNTATPEDVNTLALEVRKREKIPHLSEEFGILRSSEDRRLMRNMWANFLGGAAGGGTGSNMDAFMHFLEITQIPFHLLQPANDLCKQGGSNVFCAAIPDKLYLAYSFGSDIELSFSGEYFDAFWYDPTAPGDLRFAETTDFKRYGLPISNKDWVLLLTKETVGFR